MNSGVLIIISAGLCAVISGLFGMAGGMVFMGIILSLMSVSAAMVVHGVVQSISNGSRAFILKSHIRWDILGWFFLCQNGSDPKGHCRDQSCHHVCQSYGQDWIFRHTAYRGDRVERFTANMGFCLCPASGHIWNQDRNASIREIFRYRVSEIYAHSCYNYRRGLPMARFRFIGLHIERDSRQSYDCSYPIPNSEWLTQHNYGCNNRRQRPEHAQHGNLLRANPPNRDIHKKTRQER